MITLDTLADFTWGFGNEFFLETSEGNYIWSCPDYIAGNNTIRRFDGNYKDWIKSCNIPFGRDKGKHIIKNYCGEDVKFV